MNKNIYIYSIIFIILFYIFINKYNKDKKYIKNVILGGVEDLENKEKSNEIVSDLTKLLNTEQYKNIEQSFNDITHISEFIDNKFNYNSFQLHFSINRGDSMITDLEGGILTFGKNTTNFHNFFIYLRKKELIVGLQGYNTHITINLDKIKNAQSIHFKLLYNNPYLNVYVKTDTISGYIDYLGNINNIINENFRLYLHPFYNTWCSIGTSSFILNDKDKEDTFVFSASKALLPAMETSISNIALIHNKRDMNEIIKEDNIYNTTNYNNLNISSGKIIIMNLELSYSNADYCSLVKLYTNKKDFIELIKINTKEIKEIQLILNYDNNSKKKTLVNIQNIDSANVIYIEIIPYIDKNVFCIYIDNNFYKYIIDFDLIIYKKIKNEGEGAEQKKINNVIFTDIIINEINEQRQKTATTYSKIVETFELYEEDFIYNRANEIIKLVPIIDKKKSSKYKQYWDFEKNIKMEYFKLSNIEETNSENIIYKISVLDIYNNWNIITKIRITKTNRKYFSNKELLINNNLYGSKYKFEVYTDHYYLQPFKYLKKIKTEYIIDKNSPTSIVPATPQLWTFKYASRGNKYIIYKKLTPAAPYKDFLGSITAPYTIEKKENTEDIYYLKEFYGQYIYATEENKYKKKPTKNNCEIMRIPYTPENIPSANLLIDIYGIENPYPKLYIKNNNLTKSNHPCSDIYSKNDSLMIDRQSSFIKDFNEKVAKIEWGPVDNNKIVEGNIYNFKDRPDDSNMIYNFCSNDIKNYENKFYRYNFKINPYYNINKNNKIKTEKYKKKKNSNKRII